MIYRVEDGDFKDMATQHMLAPIFSGLKAEKALSKGDLFIINDTLYKATAAIALNATITIGTNAALASTISEELSEGNSNILSSAVDLSSYTSTSNYYDVKSDGFIKVSYNSSGSVVGQVRAIASDNSSIALLGAIPNSQTMSVLVKKGMKIHISNASSFYAVLFYPLVSTS